MNKYKNTSKKGKNAIKERWIEYEKKLQKEIINKKRLPDYWLHLARICGFLAGDGSVYINKGGKNSYHYNICFFPDHISLVKTFVKSFNFLYPLTPRIKKIKKYYRLRLKSKLIYRNLTSFSNFGVLKWNIPLAILKTKELKKEWLRAFFDCEGCVGKRAIQVQSVNKKGLYSVQRLLRELDINSKMYIYQRKNKKWNINYILMILGKENIKKYIQLIGFNHSEKLKKLINLCPDGTTVLRRARDTVSLRISRFDSWSGRFYLI